MPHLACSAGSRANAVLVELVERGLLDADEYARMMIPTLNRTLAEFLAPLRAEPLVSALSVEEHSLVALPDILLEEYQATHSSRRRSGRPVQCSQSRQPQP
ncbi:hypothetical protein ACFXJM_33275 [Streptomyces massasporeus]